MTGKALVTFACERQAGEHALEERPHIKPSTVSVSRNSTQPEGAQIFLLRALRVDRFQPLRHRGDHLVIPRRTRRKVRFSILTAVRHCGSAGAADKNISTSGGSGRGIGCAGCTRDPVWLLAKNGSPA